MCLAAFAINASARWPLIIASNRDEFFDRPTLPLARWQTAAGQTIISGRDGRAGGTWLGVTPEGRVALLTNVREGGAINPGPALRSRGELVLRWLAGAGDAEQFRAENASQSYAGFNLVVGDWQTGCWTWLSNRSPGPDDATGPARHAGWTWKSMPPGIYGLSNAALDTPWPKTVALKGVLADAIANPAMLEDALWSALASRSRAAPADLPDTGMPAPFERALSSAFVDAPERGYGTRCSTLLTAAALDETGCAVEMSEKTFAGASQNKAVVAVKWRRAGMPA